MRHITLAMLIYLSIALQSSEIAGWTTAASRPFLPGLTLVAIAFWCEGTTAIIWSACVGLLLDGLSPERLGVQTSLAAMIGLGLQMRKSKSGSEGMLVVVATAFLTTAIWRALSPMTYAVLASRVVDPIQVLSSAVGDAIWTAGIAVILVMGSRLLLGGPVRREASVVERPNRWTMLTGPT